MIGNVSTETKLTTAVYDIDSAVSPPDILVIMFDVTPPGQQARIISPTAISPVSPSPCEMVNATMGSNTI